MTRQQVSPPKKFMKLKDFWRFVRQHKWIATLVVALLVLAVTVGICSYIQYTQRFSKQDFDTIETMAETVLKNSGGKDVQANRTCSYERPTEVSPLHLYCTIELVSFLKYQNDAQASHIAQTLEQTIQNQYLTSGSTVTFMEHPSLGYSDITVQLPSRRHEHQCNFQIGSGRYAQNIAPFLPRKVEDNLIGLYFECSAESRAEYFPVTYRQG